MIVLGLSMKFVSVTAIYHSRDLTVLLMVFVYFLELVYGKRSAELWQCQIAT